MRFPRRLSLGGRRAPSLVPPRVLASVFVAGALVAATADAAPPTKVSDPVPAPGRSIVGTDDASAIAHSPANIAFLPGPELRWTSVSMQEASPLPFRGHAVDLAAPFFFMASGLRVDFMDPPQAATFPFQDTYQWVRWAFAARAGRSLAFGSSLGWSISEDPNLDGQFSITTGLTARPGPCLLYTSRCV